MAHADQHHQEAAVLLEIIPELLQIPEAVPNVIMTATELPRHQQQVQELLQPGLHVLKLKDLHVPVQYRSVPPMIRAHIHALPE